MLHCENRTVDKYFTQGAGRLWCRVGRRFNVAVNLVKTIWDAQWTETNNLDSSRYTSSTKLNNSRFLNLSAHDLPLLHLSPQLSCSASTFSSSRFTPVWFPIGFFCRTHTYMGPLLLIALSGRAMRPWFVASSPGRDGSIPCTTWKKKGISIVTWFWISVEWSGGFLISFHSSEQYYSDFPKNNTSNGTLLRFRKRVSMTPSFSCLLILENDRAGQYREE